MMKSYEELKPIIQKRRGNIITWAAILVIFSVVLLNDPALIASTFQDIWNIPTILISTIIFILIALSVRVLFPYWFKVLFNLVHYILVIVILSSVIHWNLEPENITYEPLITLFAFLVAVMVYLRQHWNISENKHEIVELFKKDESS